MKTMFLTIFNLFLTSSYNILSLVTTFLTDVSLESILINLFLFTNTASWFGVKFFLLIAFLILIRGGLPRYRYDYLTKLGWLKFLSLVVWFFLTLNLIYFLI